jgi:hypothetical protein
MRLPSSALTAFAAAKDQRYRKEALLVAYGRAPGPQRKHAGERRGRGYHGPEDEGHDEQIDAEVPDRHPAERAPALQRPEGRRGSQGTCLRSSLLRDTCYNVVTEPTSLGIVSICHESKPKGGVRTGYALLGCRRALCRGCPDPGRSTVSIGASLAIGASVRANGRNEIGRRQGRRARLAVRRPCSGRPEMGWVAWNPHAESPDPGPPVRP